MECKWVLKRVLNLWCINKKIVSDIFVVCRLHRFLSELQLVYCTLLVCEIFFNIVVVVKKTNCGEYLNTVVAVKKKRGKKIILWRIF